MSRNQKSIRRKWEAKKGLLKIRISLLFVVFMVIGLELGTPDYSLTGHISEQLIESSETLHSLIQSNEKIRSYFIKEGKTEESNFVVAIFDSGALGGPIKTIIIVLIAYFVLYVISMKDPFTNYPLLQSLGSLNNGKRRSWCKGNEIRFYANNIPSNLIFTVCGKCIHVDGCANAIKENDQDSIKRWSAIYGVLHPDLIEKDLSHVYACRKAFYYKYSSLALWVSMSAYYVLIRGYEYAFHESVNMNHGLLVYIGILILICSLYSWVNAISKDQSGGAWCRHKAHVEWMLNHRFLDEAYRERVCRCYDNPVYLKRRR